MSIESKFAGKCKKIASKITTSEKQVFVSYVSCVRMVDVFFALLLYEGCNKTKSVNAYTNDEALKIMRTVFAFTDCLALAASTTPNIAYEYVDISKLIHVTTEFGNDANNRHFKGIANMFSNIYFPIIKPMVIPALGNPYTSDEALQLKKMKTILQKDFYRGMFNISLTLSIFNPSILYDDLSLVFKSENHNPPVYDMPYYPNSESISVEQLMMSGNKMEDKIFDVEGLEYYQVAYSEFYKNKFKISADSILSRLDKHKEFGINIFA